MTTPFIFCIQGEAMGKVVPIKFKGMDCPRCGGTNTIQFVDINEQLYTDINEEATGAYSAVCTKCGQRYTMRWSINDEMLFEDPSRNQVGFISEYNKFIPRNLDEVMAKEFELPPIESQTEE